MTLLLITDLSMLSQRQQLTIPAPQTLTLQVSGISANPLRTPDEPRAHLVDTCPFSIRFSPVSLPRVEEEEFITNWEETVENFDDMGLKEGVLRGIYGYGFVKPSPIQQKGILPVIQGKDTIAQVINIFNNKPLFE